MVEEIIGGIIPLSICVILPIVIVWLTMRTKINAQNKRSAVLMEALKVNPNVDVDQLVNALGRPSRTPEQVAQRRLLYGLICSLIGLVLIVSALLFGGKPGFEEDMYSMIMMGGVLLAVGIPFLVIYFISYNKNREE